MFLGEIKSVYVRNLPPTVSPSEIEEEFKNFGKLKQPEGVVIRSRKVHILDLFFFICSILERDCFPFIATHKAEVFVYVQDVGVCYAFVEFEDISSVHNAVQVFISFELNLKNPNIFISFELNSQNPNTMYLFYKLEC